MVFSWAHPWFLLLLPLILIWIFIVRRIRASRSVAVNWSDIQLFTRAGPLPGRFQAAVIPGTRLLVLLLLVGAAAGPRFGQGRVSRSTEGLDIVLVVDTSQSMRALDLKIGNERFDRLEVVKAVLAKFIGKRHDDRIGMVVFGAEAFTQAPLTLDHGVLLKFLKQIRIGMAGPSTAIGDGLATAVRRLKDLEAKSRVIILLSDGENTAGMVDPREAAEAAKTLGVKVYTIGVGTNGMVPMPVQGLFGPTTRNQRVRIDEKLLKDIASTTGGQTFMAADTDALLQVYDTIDKLEKTKTEVQEYVDYEDASFWFLLPALLLMMGEALLSTTRLRRLPG